MNQRAVIYSRVSTDKQAEHGISLDMQIARCREYAETHGFELLDTVVDAGFSGKSIANRPGMTKILELVNRRQIEHVICFKLDRSFRNTIEGLQAVELMAKKGVSLHVVDEQSAVKSESADDEFLLVLKMGLAQRERKVVAERTRAALARKRERNEFCGGEPPYGYRSGSGTLIPDASEQAVIRKIRTLRNKGYSLRRIVACLQADGHLNRRGKAFSKTSVERILHKEAA